MVKGSLVELRCRSSGAGARPVRTGSPVGLEPTQSSRWRLLPSTLSRLHRVLKQTAPPDRPSRLGPEGLLSNQPRAIGFSAPRPIASPEPFLVKTKPLPSLPRYRGREGRGPPLWLAPHPLIPRAPLQPRGGNIEACFRFLPLMSQSNSGTRSRNPAYGGKRCRLRNHEK